MSKGSTKNGPKFSDGGVRRGEWEGEESHLADVRGRVDLLEERGEARRDIFNFKTLAPC